MPFILLAAALAVSMIYCVGSREIEPLPHRMGDGGMTSIVLSRARIDAESGSAGEPTALHQKLLSQPIAGHSLFFHLRTRVFNFVWS